MEEILKKRSHLEWIIYISQHTWTFHSSEQSMNLCNVVCEYWAQKTDQMSYKKDLLSNGISQGIHGAYRLMVPGPDLSLCEPLFFYAWAFSWKQNERKSSDFMNSGYLWSETGNFSPHTVKEFCSQRWHSEPSLFRPRYSETCREIHRMEANNCSGFSLCTQRTPR